jgi:hypothetical protein
VCCAIGLHRVAGGTPAEGPADEDGTGDDPRDQEGEREPADAPGAAHPYRAAPGGRAGQVRWDVPERRGQVAQAGRELSYSPRQVAQALRQIAQALRQVAQAGRQVLQLFGES